MNIITVENVTKKFKIYKKPEGLSGSFKSLLYRRTEEKFAVKNISFEIKQGEFVGFIGPNGAGKTTTLKLLTGILYPTDGKLSVMHYNPSNREKEFKKKFAIVLGQKSQLWQQLPAIETFNLLAKIYEIPDGRYRRKLDELVELMDLQDVLHVSVRKLSLGQRMKCELLAALLHDPKVLFLDEPTIGLDVVSQQKIRGFLKEYNKRNGVTVLLTSHYMNDVEDLCKRLIVINRGKIGYDGDTKKIILQYSEDKMIRLLFESEVAKADLEPYGKIVEYNPFEVVMNVPIEDSQKIISQLIKKFPIADISMNNVTLEEIVADMFSKKSL